MAGPRRAFRARKRRWHGESGLDRRCRTHAERLRPMKAPLLSPVEITRFEKTGGPLTKRVYLKPDGAIANDSSDCRMSRGVMHRQHLLDWRALACLIEETPRNTAYALGVMRPDLPDSVPLVTRRDPRSAQPGFATRTAETILFREG